MWREYIHCRRWVGFGIGERGEFATPSADCRQICAWPLVNRFTPGEDTIAERMLREYGGTIPDKQLLSEIGLAVAIHRGGRR